MRRFAAMMLIIILGAACSSVGVPRVTPTVAPTNTPTSTQPATLVAQEPSRTPIPTATSTDQPTSTATPEPTFTDSPTPTTTFTPTNTDEPTETPSATFTHTPVPSDTPTPTATFTPSPTDTPNPSETSTLTPTPTFTPSPTATFTPLPTDTATSTDEPTATPTDTPSATATATLTFTPLPTTTPTLTQTASSTPTVTASITPSPTIPASSTPTLLPSPTPLPIIQPTDTPTNTPLPSPTPTFTTTPPPTSTPTLTLTSIPPTQDLTALAEQFFATQTVFAATLTARAPTETPTVTLTPDNPPTLDVTPTFVTAEGPTPPAEDLGIITPEPGEPTEEQFVLTNTPTPAPTVAISVPIPATISLVDLRPPENPVVNTSPRPFALTTGGGAITSGSIDIVPGLQVALFERNPVDPGSYVLTDTNGVLYLSSGGSASPMTFSPFSEFVPRSREENNAIVRDIAWSPDGRKVAFIAFQGVYFFEPGVRNAAHLLADCPYDTHPGCELGGGRQFNHESRKVTWSPGSDAILVNATITSGGRGVAFVMGEGQNTAQQPPPLYYDYANWSRDGTRLIVSGRSPTDRVIIGTVNRDGSAEQILFDATAVGYWVQDAVQRSNGQIVALGRQGDPFGPMRIINQNGDFLTGDIGGGPPQSVEWSPDGSAVLVTAGGRRYVASVNGSVQDITDSTAGSTGIGWVTGGLPSGGGTGSSSGAPPDFVPSGVVEGSRYTPGQQLRVLSESLNLRAQPNTGAEVVGGVFSGEYVAVLAGPASFDGIEWWQVQTASGNVGWLAGVINGFDTLAG